MTETPVRCEICQGPHPTKSHNAWTEMPKEMTRQEITAELEKYAPILQAMKTGGMDGAEKALGQIGMAMNGATCFCGTPNHTGADHLRWLADKETENSDLL